MIRNRLLITTGVLAAFIAVPASQSPVALAAATAFPVANGGIQALYKGHMVSYAKLGRTLGATYCDDFRGSGKLTCFASNHQMEANLLAKGGYGPREAARVARELGVADPPTRTTRAVSPAGNTCGPVAYADLYSGANGTGSKFTMFCNYEDFATVGWKNRAHSGKGVSGLGESIFVGPRYSLGRLIFISVGVGTVEFSHINDSAENAGG